MNVRRRLKEEGFRNHLTLNRILISFAAAISSRSLVSSWSRQAPRRKRNKSHIMIYHEKDRFTPVFFVKKYIPTYI